jgi:hypothetical protein
MDLRGEAIVNDKQVTEALASKILGWKICRDRFITSGRSWVSRWRFKPMTHLDDAFRLLDGAGANYRLTATAGGKFTAEVRVGVGRGTASGAEKAETITVALARALGLEI